MPKSVNIRLGGFEAHYKQWRLSHKGAITYEKLLHYIHHGDEFGRSIPAEFLAKLCHTTKVTMLKWLTIIKEEEKEK